MSMRQMTVDIPEEVAEQFAAKFPLPEQSSVVANPLQRASMPKLTDEEWESDCEAATDDPETNQLIADWECTIADGIDELEREEAACGRTIESVCGKPS